MESCLLSWFAFQFLCLGFCSSGTVRKTQRPSDEIRQECHLNVKIFANTRDNTAVRVGIFPRMNSCRGTTQCPRKTMPNIWPGTGLAVLLSRTNHMSYHLAL